MLWNLRNLGMAAEDGPWFSGRSVLLGSMLRPPRHRRWPHRGRSLLLANPPRTALRGVWITRASASSGVGRLDECAGSTDEGNASPTVSVQKPEECLLRSAVAQPPMDGGREKRPDLALRRRGAAPSRFHRLARPAPGRLSVPGAGPNRCSAIPNPLAGLTVPDHRPGGGYKPLTESGTLVPSDVATPSY